MDEKEKILHDVIISSFPDKLDAPMEYAVFNDVRKFQAINAMDIHARQVSIEFAKWILQESILPRDTNWFDAGKHLTSEELYTLFINQRK